MKFIVIPIFSCLFTLFVPTAAQADDFTGNTCHEAGANCQTQADWLRGWCKAASAAGYTEQSPEECAQAVGANDPKYQTQPTQNQNQSENQNRQSSSSSSGQSGDGDQQSTGRLQFVTDRDANIQQVKQQSRFILSAQGGGGTQQSMGSLRFATDSHADAQPITREDDSKDAISPPSNKCRYWKVHRSDPQTQICVPYGNTALE